MTRDNSPEALAARAAERKARFEDEKARMQAWKEANPEAYQKALADARAYTIENQDPNWNFIPRWSRDKDVARYFADDVWKGLLNMYDNLTREQAKELVHKHLESAVEQHRADNEGARKGHDFWDEAVGELGSIVGEMAGL